MPQQHPAAKRTAKASNSSATQNSSKDIPLGVPSTEAGTVAHPITEPDRAARRQAGRGTDLPGASNSVPQHSSWNTTPGDHPRGDVGTVGQPRKEADSSAVRQSGGKIGDPSRPQVQPLALPGPRRDPKSKQGSSLKPSAAEWGEGGPPRKSSPRKDARLASSSKQSTSEPGGGEGTPPPEQGVGKVAADNAQPAKVSPPGEDSKNVRVANVSKRSDSQPTRGEGPTAVGTAAATMEEDSQPTKPRKEARVASVSKRKAEPAFDESAPPPGRGLEKGAERDVKEPHPRREDRAANDSSARPGKGAEEVKAGKAVGGSGNSGGVEGERGVLQERRKGLAKELFKSEDRAGQIVASKGGEPLTTDTQKRVDNSPLHPFLCSWRHDFHPSFCVGNIQAFHLLM